MLDVMLLPKKETSRCRSLYWELSCQDYTCSKNLGDGPKDVPPEAFCGHPAVGPSDSLLQVPPREQQVRMRSYPSKLTLQSSHAQNVDVAMQRRCNLSRASTKITLCTFHCTCGLAQTSRCSGTSPGERT